MPRFVPIIIQVSGGGDADKAVQQITNAFKKMESQAGISAKGSSNAFTQYLGADFLGGLARQAFNAFRMEAQKFITDSVRLAQEMQNALLGVASVAAFKGIDKQQATDAVNNLFIVKSGLISVADASVALKNLLQSGFGLEKSITLISRFGDSAAFGKQAALSYGEAIRSATEGIKNQNSILVDNAGITKNIEVMLKERGFTMQDLSDKVKGLAAREALYKGLLAESAAQLGDSEKLVNTYTGSIAAQDKAYQDLQREIGLMIINNPRMIESNKIVTEQLNATTEATKDQGTETAKTANQMITAWAVVKAALIPFVALVKNLAVTVGASMAVIITGAIGYILKGLEDTLNAVDKTINGIINSGVRGVNFMSALAGLPQIPERVNNAPLDLGSRHILERMNVAINDLSQAAKGISPTLDDIGRATARVIHADLLVKPKDQSADALAEARLARANQLGEEQLTGDVRKGGARKKAAEHLSDLEKIDQSSERATLKTLYQLGQRSGFVAGTNQSAAAHNVGSRHPLGRALDFSVKGKSPAQIAQFISELREEGFTVFDERTRPKGQKKWSGPHLHAEFAAGGIGKDKGAGPTEFIIRSLMTQMRGGPLATGPLAASAGLQPEIRLSAEQKYLALRKEELNYDQRHTEAVYRLRNIEKEAHEDYQNNKILEMNLDADLLKQRLTNADNQMVEQRRLLSAKGEQYDLERSIASVQDEIANGPYNESLRIQLALLQDIADIRRRDEDAIKAQNRAQLELADAEIFHSEQARAIVLGHLSSSRSQTEVFADAIVDAYEAVNDVVLKGVQRITGGIRGLDSLIAGLISRLTNRLFQKLLDVLIPGGGGGQAQAAGAGGGGLGGILSGILGGRGQTAGGALTGGFAGGPGGGGFFGGGFTGSGGIGTLGSSIANPFTGFLAGGGISAPTSLSSQAASQAVIQQSMLDGALGGAAAGVGPAGLLGGMPGLAAVLPFLGMGLGSGLGGGSRFGSILGGAGGLIAGGIGAAFLAPGLFAATGALGSMGPVIAGLLTNPVTAVAAVALLVGAIALGKNAARRRDEKKRDEISNNTGTEIWKLIGEARSLGTIGALARWDEIAVNYSQQIAAIKDGKTKRHAEKQWKDDFLPLLEIVKKRAAEGDRAKDIEKHLIPEFAMGGFVPFRGGMSTLIKVRPGEVMMPPGGGFGVTVPGVDRGYDSVFTSARPGTRVLTKSQQAGARGFAGGGTVGGGGDIVVNVTDDRVAALLKLLLDSLDTSDGRKIVVKHVRGAMQNYGL